MSRDDVAAMARHGEKRISLIKPELHRMCMPVAAGALGSCERIYSSLEKEVDSVFDAFLDAAGGAEEFHGRMGRIEGQLALAEKTQSADSDLSLNETAVIADKVSLELAEAEKLALGAALSETEEKWAQEFERARTALGSLAMHMKKIRSANSEHDTLEARSALLSFRKAAASCHMCLMRLKAMLASRRHRTHAKVDAARRKVAGLRAGVGRNFERLAKIRLQKKIAEAKGNISAFMKKTVSGRIFVDHKHLTFSAGQRVERLPFTQAIRFALGEIAPIEDRLSRAGKGDSVVVGSYEKTAKELVLKLGERVLQGDSVVYKERTYHIPC